MTPFSAIITPTSMSFTSMLGKVHHVTEGHTNWDEIRETIKAIKVAQKACDDAEVESLRTTLDGLVDIVKTIIDASYGRVEVKGGCVYYGGEPVHGALTQRILWGITEGFDMDAHLRFLDDVMENPSKRAVDELYRFIEANQMGITEDGCVLAYKRVREDFKDIYTGKMDNSPGQIVKMRRNAVNDNKEEVCSAGLHVCAMSYLPYYGTGEGNTIVLVKIKPRNFVSIPVDYKDAKARVCEYEVLCEYDGSDKDDILSLKRVWNEDDLTSGYRDDDDDDDDDDYFDDDDDYFDDEYYRSAYGYGYGNGDDEDKEEANVEEGSGTSLATELGEWIEKVPPPCPLPPRYMGLSPEAVEENKRMWVEENTKLVEDTKAEDETSNTDEDALVSPEVQKAVAAALVLLSSIPKR